ncbi:hypothetical protein HYW67_02775 [Candidatus Parcubacteria bacterium]|nr:hypothetical protein [Candidatus Parcubacteria bacterium]
MADDRPRLTRDNDPEPRFTFGPDFESGDGGWGERLSNWTRRNSRSITIGVIVAVLVLGGLYSLSRSRTGGIGELFRARGPATIEEVLPEEGIEGVNLSPPAAEQPVGAAPTAEPGALTTTASAITVAASRGEGITHLARRALRAHLESNSVDFTLRAEHKIYVEDYLVKKTDAQRLQIGEERTFSNDLVREALARAKDLSPKQIENLSQYVSLVPSLR